jgi:SAM-dependent methyltransferase
MDNRTPPEVIASWPGVCPICRTETTFSATGSWFREYLTCEKCHNGSVPRERALMKVIDQLVPNWRDLSVHESSPAPRGASIVLARECKNYIASQYFPDRKTGEIIEGVSCQDLEKQTFASNVFDLVVTQDVFEHVFHPDQAHREIWRTLKPGGYHIFTTPIYKDILKTRIVAVLDAGRITHLEEPEYHGNPIDPNGSLVTVRYGYDAADKIAEWAPFDVEIRRFNDKTAGIVAEFSEVTVCRKRPA